MKGALAHRASTRRRFLKWTAGIAVGGTVAGAIALRYGRAPIRVASHHWPGYEFMFLARDRGWLPATDVTFLETRTLVESHAAFREGRADAATLTLDQVIEAADGGMGVTVVLVFDVSAGADAVFARAPILKLADLKGRRIGAEPNALGRLMTGKVLAVGGLRREDIVLVPLSGPHDAQWQAGTLDAIVTYEPYASMIEAGGAVRLFDSRDMPQTIFDVLAVRTDRLTGRAAQIQTLVRGHFRALEAWNTNPIDTAYRLSRHHAMSADAVAAQFRGLALPDIDHNRHLLGAPAAELHQALEEIRVALEMPAATRRRLVAHLRFEPTYLPATPP